VRTAASADVVTTTLLAANDGGHIVQLRSLVDRFGLEGERLWVTPRTPQTESLLAGERVFWAHAAPTRDWRAAVRNAAAIRRLLRSEDVSRVISTGSSLAVSALPQAGLHRIPAHYIESVTRTDGFSLSGRVLRRVPGVSLYAQWPHLAGGRWLYRGSVLDGFHAEAGAAQEVRTVVVSLGTSSTFGFRRLLERLVAIVPAGVDVLWQTGATVVDGLPIDARPAVPAAEFSTAIEAADVIVAHAGAGIALTALDAGKVPILVPRVASLGEHIDDHQGEIARHLAVAGLAVAADAGELTWETMTAASGIRARRVDRPPPFVLDERRLPDNRP
jgi:UDP-N-acetylglucosamine--N-acetylmuramyl-(pentapeptide) pyrophosphoryl-undecaprenol N-acetylglucosamine transferase